MRRRSKLKHEFVDFIPSDRKDGVVYVSMKYAKSVHNCCCGGGNKVLTPLSPTDWKLTFDGETISLYPSIGNWAFPCQSHYWTENDRVKWARQWTEGEIEAGKRKDESNRARFYQSRRTKSR